MKKHLIASALCALLFVSPASAQYSNDAVTGASGGVSSVGAGCGTSTGGSPITATGNVAASMTTRANTATTDTILSTDCGNRVTESNASAVATALPVATTTGFGSGFFFDIVNLGAGTVTITPTTSTINGAATLTLAQGQGASISSDGTNYSANLGKGGSGGITALTGDCTASGTGSVVTTCRQTAPVYIVNHWYEAGDEHGGVFASNSGANNGKILCYPEYFHGPATISALGARVNTVSAGGNYQVAIYANNASTFRPTGTALVSSASLSTTTAGAVNAAVSLSVTGTPLLWWCSNSDNGTATLSGITPSFMAGVGGTATQANLSAGSARLVGISVPSVTFGTWPDLTSATFTELTGGVVPSVQFEIGSVP